MEIDPIEIEVKRPAAQVVQVDNAITQKVIGILCELNVVQAQIDI